MPTYPRDAAERQSLRMRKQAEPGYGTCRVMSGACCEHGGARHAPHPGGCTDDGSGCLCPCHDKEE